jgi:hypothetical protein
MDDSELFDVFAIDNNPEPEQKTIARPERVKSKKDKKDKKEKHKSKSKDASNGLNGKRAHDEDSQNSVGEDDINGADSSPPATKKSRRSKENPIVVDSFETESDQIVRATTGLQGVAPTDENIVIKKKVLILSERI